MPHMAHLQQNEHRMPRSTIAPTEDNANTLHQSNMSREDSSLDSGFNPMEDADDAHEDDDESQESSASSATASSVHLPVFNNNTNPVVPHTDFQRPYTTEMQIETSLLKILKDTAAPLGSYQRIMQWAKNASNANYHFAPNQTSYQAQLKTLETTLNMQDLRPRHTLCHLEGHIDPVTVVHFDFVAHLKALLADPLLNNIDNLVVNPNNRFMP